MYQLHFLLKLINLASELELGVMSKCQNLKVLAPKIDIDKLRYIAMSQISVINIPYKKG